MKSIQTKTTTRWLLTATVFWGSFLLFSVELLVANLLTPRFGGGAITWLTALMLFQVVLFFGYAYAHYFAPKLKGWHLLIIGACGLMLPVSVDTSLLGVHPIAEVIWAVSCAVLFPFFVLSTTSVVIQMWWAHSDQTDGEPYSLYASSNFGSVIALLSYPFLIQPLIGLSAQRYAWTVGYLLFGALMTWCWFSARPKIEASLDEETAVRAVDEKPGIWLVLSILPSALLLATTHYLTSEIGSFPLLWILPLLAYLLSFIIVFGGRIPLGWMHNWWPELVIVAISAPLTRVFSQVLPIVLILLSLFLVSTAVHYFLYTRRPPEKRLSIYFLWISAGGAIGGIVGNLVPPVLFNSSIEYFWLLLLIAVFLGIWEHKRTLAWLRNVPVWVGSPRLIFWILPFISFWAFVAPQSTTFMADRNVYGSLKIEDRDSDGRPSRWIQHGATIHGHAFLDEKRATATTYYYHGGGIHQVHATARAHRASNTLAMGVIGLGAGTMAEYVQLGDTMHAYELNPLVVQMAQDHFPYLKQSKVPVQVEIGDGLQLLKASTHKFDVLTVDAFSGDAVPLNLLTYEALNTYFEHLNEDGVVVFHITNRYFALKTIIGRAAHALGLPAAHTLKNPQDNPELPTAYEKNWTVVVSQNKQVMDALLADGWSTLESDGGTPWTDDLSSPLEALIVVRRWMGWP